MTINNCLRFFSFMLLVTMLVGCTTSPKQEIYALLADIEVAEYSAADIMVPTYDSPSRYTDRFPEEYATLAAYGREGVAYILQYVIEHEQLDYYNAMFFVCCSYQILGMNEFLDVDMFTPIEHARALQEYLP